MSPRPDRRLRSRAADERGFVLPVAMGLLAIGLLLASVAIVSAVELSNASNGDRRAKQAIQAADVGVQTALYRLNSLQSTVDDIVKLDPCIVPTVDVSTGAATALTVNATLSASAPGYCSQTAAEKVGNEATFRYQMNPIGAVAAKIGVSGASGLALNLDRKIVSTGTYTAPGGKTVTRRVLANVTALDGTNLLNPTKGGYSVIATSTASTAFNMTGGTIGLAAKHAGVLSAGGFTRSGGSICGDSVYSTGAAPTLNCAGGGVSVLQDASAAQALTSQLPTPTRPAAASRIYTPVSCVALLGCSPASAAAPTNVTISSALAILPSIPAGKYLDVCNLTISAGELIGNGTAANPSYIYLEPPNNNGCTTTSINITGTGQLCQTSTLPVALCTSLVGLTDPRALQILVGVDPTTGASGTVTFNSSGILGVNVLPSYVMVNAPTATVNIQGTSEIIGGVIGKTVNVSGSGQVQASPTVTLDLQALLTLPLKLLPIYTVKSYKECSPTAPTSSDPTSGC